MKISIGQKLFFLSIIVIAGNGFIGYNFYRNNTDLADSEVWVLHTEEVINESIHILSLSKDLEITAHRFVMTGDTTLLELEQLYQQKILSSIEKLRKLTADNSSQQMDLDSLYQNMGHYFSYFSRTIQLRNLEGMNHSISYMSFSPDRRYTAHIHQFIKQIQQKENSLLKERKQIKAQGSMVLNQFSIVLFIIMTVFTVLLLIVTGNYLFQNREKKKASAALVLATTELASRTEEMEKREEELVIADQELIFQNEEKDKRAEELLIANIELAFQTEEKEKRAGELVIADKELLFQNEEKEKRAEELMVADKELIYQNKEKEKRAEELMIANIELAYQNDEKEKRAEELVLADKELLYQNEEKEKRAAELTIADKELVYQKKEKSKRAQELVIANRELIYQNTEKEKRASELSLANIELVYQNGEKEKRAAELHIANKELVFQNEEKEKRAEELIIANKELESFSYSVSHDLRAPLRAVHGFARMLKDDYGSQLNPEANRIMDNVMKNAMKMGKLLDDLLTFSRLGKKELVKFMVPMHDMVTQLCNETQKEQKDHAIVFLIRDLHPAMADNNSIKQAWVNLISNAVKYSRLNTKATVEIDSAIEGDEVVYSIKDNGAGFDMRFASKLFGVFQRLHTDDKFEGTGVGLAIVHRIISKHGGRVWAEGKVNQGAIFHFSLPKASNHD